MRPQTFLSRVTLPVLLLLAGLTATNSALAASEPIREGTIEQISEIQVESHHHHGLGAIIGGGIGLGLGSLVGGGHGRDVAQVAGALAGGVAGEKIAAKQDTPGTAQQIVVRLRNGVLVVVTQSLDTSPGLRVGQSVYVEGTGNDATVLPR